MARFVHVRNLKNLIEQQDISVSKLCQIANMDRSTIHNILTGKKKLGAERWGLIYAAVEQWRGGYCFNCQQLKAELEVPEELTLDSSVDRLDLSVRAANGLDRAKIKTIRDLTEKTYKELLRINNIGWITLKEYQKALHDIGLSLKIEPPKEINNQTVPPEMENILLSELHQ